MGVTTAPFINFAITESIYVAEVQIKCRESRSYYQVSRVKYDRNIQVGTSVLMI